MKKLILVLGILAIFNWCYSQECKCIDEAFSSSDNAPIVVSKLGSIEVAICGYSSNGIGELINNKYLIGSGFNLIHCDLKKSIFIESEYYTDSIVLNNDRIDIYRLTYFPKVNGFKHKRVPIVKFSFFEKNNQMVIDSIISIPHFYLSKEYLSELNKEIEEIKREDKSHEDLYELNHDYLFLKAVADKKAKLEYINSGPYDGYLGPIFSDYKTYLDLDN